MTTFLEKGTNAAGVHSRRGTAIGLMVGALLGIGQLGGVLAAVPAETPGTGQSDAAYAAGYQFGGHLAGLRAEGRDLDLEAVFRGVLDALSGARPGLSAGQMRSALAGIETPGAAGRQASVRRAIPSRARGYVDDYAALNAKRPGVVVLPSGLQYEVLKTGAGKGPGAEDTVAVKYRGFLADGVEFDSTEADAPARLRVDQIVIPGLKEAILIMHEGDSWRVTIPAALGFSGGRMLRKRDLIYEIELLAVEAPSVESSP